MQATAFFGAPPTERPPTPQAVSLRAPLALPGYRPALLGLHQSLGQPPSPPDLDPDLSKEQMVFMAIDLMVDSGKKIAAQLARTYEEYQNIPGSWLGESIASFFAAGPAGPLGVALDSWWQSSRANQAILKLNAIRLLGQEWLNSMRDEWIPAFLPLIDDIDPALYQPVSDIFDRVVAETSKIIDRIGEYKALPPRIVTEAVATFFTNVSRDLKNTADLLRQIIEALAAITRTFAEGVIQWPAVALAVALIAGGILLFR